MTQKSDEPAKSDAVLNLKGAEQHHDLKNQPGEKGDPHHTDHEASEETKTLVKDAVSENEDETQLASALKASVD